MQSSNLRLIRYIGCRSPLIFFHSFTIYCFAHLPMYYLIHHDLQLNGSTSITFSDKVILSTICFWTPVIFWGTYTTKDVFQRKYTFSIYIAMLLKSSAIMPSFYKLINIFIFYCHLWLKGLSLTYPFQLPSRSVAVTLKHSHMNQQLIIPSNTLTAVFRLPL